MTHKDKTLKFIACVTELKKNNELRYYKERYMDFSDELLGLIDSHLSPDEIYIEFGKNISDIEDDYAFNNIFYREDLFEYLLEKNYDKKEAFELMECIRKGKLRHQKISGLANKAGKDFYEWAVKVRYLPSRKHIFDCLYPLNDKFEYLCWE